MSRSGTDLRVAITSDWLTTFGGGERVLLELHALYPTAPIFTSVVDRRGLPESTRDWDIRPTVLQHIPFARRYSRALLPLMPAAFSRLDLSGYDIVVSTSSAFSKNVTTVPGVPNLCYCYTPPRYLWDLTGMYFPGLKGRVAGPLVAGLRARDLAAAARVSRFVAISNTVAERIKRIYGRACTVIYPPVDVHRIVPTGQPPEDFFLVVSRLVAYKRLDLAVQACNQLGRRLVIVGAGAELARLRRMAGPTVEFRGELADHDIAALYARCRAFLFPGLEDFGITPVEAQAGGRPVIAFGAGGVTESVVDGVTGLFFHEQSVPALVSAIERLDRMEFHARACRENAQRFDAGLFRTRMATEIADAAATPA